MREFKFRIWDKKNKSCHIKNNPYTEESLKIKDRFIVTEFTGLKDKNGKEIFEGDIIGINYEETSIKLPVKFGKYSFDKFIGECGEISESTELYGFYVENEYLYIQMLNGNVVIVGNIFNNEDIKF
ncbi:putative phage protein (TIGR01671 family) [Clostridium algifaecis]|uniref:Phage protein (TIGR01671 family) n=1 Tax=Clostridium algifaecis TaxID=1472040 RepID=A0ABS4KVT7_9CLOT|nr:YopX family protein [Clostridium algifaecis]MBP2034120.1 putative phage protein (TIGR01671 family) [Clostridium algifaecis]